MVSQLVSMRIENDNERFNIAPYGASGAVRLAGSRGFGVAATDVRIQDSALGGGRHRSTRRRSRNIIVPFAIFGNSTREIESEMRRLVRILQDDFTIPRLYVKYPDGREVWTEVHYKSGIDPQWGQDTDHRLFAQFVMTLVAPDPYWTNVQAQNYALTTEGVGRGLIKNASLTELQLSPSTSIGSFTLVNNGDVDAFPIWTIRGPGNYFRAVRRADGAVLHYTTAITAGNPVTIDSRNKTVKDATGANRYSSLAPAPKFFSLPPGETIVDLTMDGTTANSLISFYFNPRYELVFA